MMPWVKLDMVHFVNIDHIFVYFTYKIDTGVP